MITWKHHQGRKMDANKAFMAMSATDHAADRGKHVKMIGNDYHHQYLVANQYNPLTIYNRYIYLQGVGLISLKEVER
jgi:hypothetical protein